MPRKKFEELEASMGPDRLAASNNRVQQIIPEMPVHIIRTFGSEPELVAHFPEDRVPMIEQVEGSPTA